MRILLAVGWLFVGLGGLIYHLGPGQDQLELDNIDSVLKQARASVANEEWSVAIDRFDEALALLPEERKTDEFVVRLEKAKAQMMNAKLPAAREALAGLLEEVEDCPEASDELASEVRMALANSQYYRTWLMRREGLSKKEWETEIDAARQHYKIVAQHAEETGQTELAKRAAEDLESAVRLKRMDLSELQGLPLPSQ